MTTSRMGAIRPKNTQTRIHADGATDTITWVREATPARRELGLYAVLDADGDVLQRNANLSDLARFLGVLADDERIDPPLNKGWLFYIGRYERVTVDGISANYARPIDHPHLHDRSRRQTRC